MYLQRILIVIESLITALPDVLGVVNLGIGLGEIWMYCVDLGVVIGRAWEGIFENDYEKVDSSYQMMNDILTDMALTLSKLTGSGAFGFISDLCSVIKNISERLTN